MKSILIINGSLGDESGNTHVLIQHMLPQFKEKCHVDILNLQSFFKSQSSTEMLVTMLKKADGFIFTSGTYWDSWGSPMQMFLEKITEFESSGIMFGKPVAVVITMHSVGGKSVLSRLQGVLNTLGFLIPPMSGMVYSLAGKLAIEKGSSFSDDFWSLEDLQVISHNLATALKLNARYVAWPVDKDDPKRIWI